MKSLAIDYSCEICTDSPICHAQLEEVNFTRHNTKSSKSNPEKQTTEREREGRGREETQKLEVLRFHFLVDPDPEPESHPKEPELESLGSGSVLESDPP